MTRSRAASKCAWWMYCWLSRPATMAASFAMLARSAPVRPAVWRAMPVRSTSRPEASRECAPGGSPHGRAGPRGHQDLAIEAAGPEQCGVEVLEPVRSAHDDHLIAVAEAVELDEQLVQGLILLAVEAATRARHADGVELVDEDDRGLVLPCLLEELADSRGAEAGEHLDECRGALRVEVGARLVGDGLGEQGLARAGRSVEEDALRHPGTERCEALRVLQEVDDLLHLGPGLLEACDLVPVHEGLRGRLHVGRLHPRHHLEGSPEQVDDEPEHDERQPDQRDLADLAQVMADVRHLRAASAPRP